MQHFAVPLVQVQNIAEDAFAHSLCHFTSCHLTMFTGLSKEMQNESVRLPAQDESLQRCSWQAQL